MKSFLTPPISFPCLQEEVKPLSAKKCLQFLLARPALLPLQLLPGQRDLQLIAMAPETGYGYGCRLSERP